VRADLGTPEAVVKILPTELEARGYRICGTVRPDPVPLHFVGRQGRGLFTVAITVPLQGAVTYIHVLDDVFMKAGKTEPGDSFATRMRSSYNALRRTIQLLHSGAVVYVGDVLYRLDPSGAPGDRYEEDFPWKHRVPPYLMAGHTVTLWAKRHVDASEQPDPVAMLREETALNCVYRGEWAKEGWATRRGPDRRIVLTRLSGG
jgi:hypothetical protein